MNISTISQRIVEREKKYLEGIMHTVAIIGSDGAGKTTVAKHLLNTFPMPLKYVYMGRNFDSSNFILPTTQVIQFVRRFLKKKSQNGRSKKFQSLNAHFQQPDEWWTEDKRGKIFATLRLLNRIAEEWFRQFVSWGYQLRGYIVLYDRHFFFDQALNYANSADGKERLTTRVHRWLLTHWYPKPDLVIFLDAPPDVLFSRKKETTIEYLQMSREIYLHQGKKIANFIRVDTVQPLDMVYEEVSQHIMQFYGSKNPKNAYSNN